MEYTGGISVAIYFGDKCRSFVVIVKIRRCVKNIGNRMTWPGGGEAKSSPGWKQWYALINIPNLFKTTCVFWGVVGVRECVIEGTCMQKRFYCTP